MPERLTKIMAATEPADVAQLAMIEALRGIADGQKGVAETLKSLQGEMKEHARTVQDVRERVIRIEAAAVDAKVGDIEKRLAALEVDRHRRQGAVGLAEHVLKNWPAYGGFIGLVVLMVLFATGRIG